MKDKRPYNDCIEIDIGGGYDGYGKQLLILATYKIVEVEAHVVHKSSFKGNASPKALLSSPWPHTHHAIFRNQ